MLMVLTSIADVSSGNIGYVEDPFATHTTLLQP